MDAEEHVEQPEVPEEETNIPPVVVTADLLKVSEYNALVESFGDGRSNTYTPEAMTLAIRRLLVTVSNLNANTQKQAKDNRALTMVLCQLMKHAIEPLEGRDKLSNTPLQVWLFAPAQMLPVHRQGRMQLNVNANKVEAHWLEPGVQITRPTLHLPGR